MGFREPQTPGIGGLDELTPSEELWLQSGTAGVLKLLETTAPTEESGVGLVYVKSSDSKLYFKNDSGTEYELGTSSTNEKVKYDAGDTTAGYLGAKTVAGTGITLAEGDGADENKLKITNSAPDQTVAFTGGTNVTIGGTYPNFTITDNSQVSGSYQALASNLTSLAGLSYVSDSFVKMTGANTFSLDTNTYLTSLSGAVLTDQSTPQTIGATGARLAKLWATDIESTNVPTVGGSAVYYTGGTDVAVADGGTGKSSWTQYLIPYADTTTSFSQIAIGSSGQVLTSNGAGSAPSFQTISAGGAAWTAVPGTPTRTGNTTFTITGDYTSLVTTGMVIKWTESAAIKVGMVLSSTYSSPNTTVTIVGDTMASIDASSCKYFHGKAIVRAFSVAGTLGATATDVARAWYADIAYRVICAKPSVGFAGTTNNTTFDVNKNGTTMFTTKPTVATTALTGTLFTADNGTSLAINDRVSIDIDAVQTTPAIDGYIDLFILPTYYLQLT